MVPLFFRRAFSSTSSRRIFGSFSRNRSYAIQHVHPTNSTYHVQLQKPRLSFMRKALGVTSGLMIAYYLSPYQIVVSFDEDGEGEGEEDEDGEYDEYTDEEESQGFSNIMFLPLKWPEPLPRTYYKGDDPEWQEYVKFSKDKERQKALFNAILVAIRHSTHSHPQMQRALGRQLYCQRGHHWIDTIYPPAAPQEYLQFGLGLGELGIAIVGRTMSSSEYATLSRLFDPQKFATTTWNAVMLLLNSQASMIARFTKSFLPGDGPAEETQEMAIPKRTSIPIPRPSLLNKTNNTAEHPPPGSDKPCEVRLPMSPSRRVRQKTHKVEDATPPIEEVSGEEVSQARAPIPLQILADELNELWMQNEQRTIAMVNSLVGKDRPLPEVPRGQIVFTGMVEVIGDKGKAVIDVRGLYYDLTTDLITFSDIRVRRLQPLNQRPVGR